MYSEPQMLLAFFLSMEKYEQNYKNDFNKKDYCGKKWQNDFFQILLKHKIYF